MDDALMQEFDGQDDPQPVRVTANDYAYDGWLLASFQKRSGAWRCVVEDVNGRLFIHNAGQLGPTR